MAYSPIPQPVQDLTREYAGREYCSFGFQYHISCVPVDEQEDSRFDEYHRLLHTCEIVPLFLPDLPLQGTRKHEVLDCGFGTGKWINDSLEYTWDADEWENCEAKFTGVDIFDRQTSHAEDDSDGDDEERNGAVQEFIRKQWNLNAPFGRAPWKTFHLINSRFLSDGIDRSRWPVLMAEYWGLLSPGGWVQMVEVDWSFQSDNGTRLPNLEAWWNAYREALQQMGKDPIVARNLCDRLRIAGFERVTGNQISVPIGGWQRDREAFGSANVKLVSQMLESFALMPFTRVLRKSLEECKQMVQDARAELELPNARIYNRLYVDREEPCDTMRSDKKLEDKETGFTKSLAQYNAIVRVHEV